MNKKYVKIFFVFTILFSLGLAILLNILPQGIFPKLEFQSFIPSTKIEKDLSKYRHEQFSASLEQNPDECQEIENKFKKQEDLVAFSKDFKLTLLQTQIQYGSEIFLLKEFLSDEKKSYEISRYQDDVTHFLEKNDEIYGPLFKKYKDALEKKEAEVIKTEQLYEDVTNEQTVLFINSKISSFQGNYSNNFIECYF